MSYDIQSTSKCFEYINESITVSHHYYKQQDQTSSLSPHTSVALLPTGDRTTGYFLSSPICKFGTSFRHNLLWMQTALSRESTAAMQRETFFSFSSLTPGRGLQSKPHAETSNLLPLTPTKTFNGQSNNSDKTMSLFSQLTVLSHL